MGYWDEWKKADDEGARSIIERWLSGDGDAYCVVYYGLQATYLKVAEDILQGDTERAANIFVQTFEEIYRGLLQRKEGFMYKGKNKFVKFFNNRLEWRCLTELRLRGHLIPPKDSILGGTTWGRELGLEEEDETPIIDTLSDEKVYTVEDGHLPRPEEYAEQRESEAKAEKEHTEKMKGFLQELSHQPELAETYKAWRQIEEEARGVIGVQELNRRIREALNISPTTLGPRKSRIDRIHEKWFGFSLSDQWEQKKKGRRGKAR